ncbi:GtrA family protein [Rhizorhapis suberifaciens]|uniref:Putative flippase GtrA n=1 Tax=Rhizorhapis suberifaciens TaxID=13656 RepID=A0A840HQ53_9SPHN|nr:GtrA family protein [Rhizorhapis suberifaciens]MBB4639750.1 putative flippase GtrA [Rhizorhapis suberifaciens]
MIELIKRGSRFGVVGAICTIIGYITFVFAAEHTHYMLAALLSWISGALFGFALNRSFTFGIRGSEKVRRHFVLFFSGSLAQLGLASAGYWLLIGVLHLPPVVAFPINLIMTAAMMFLYLNFVAFRPKT